MKRVSREIEFHGGGVLGIVFVTILVSVCLGPAESRAWINDDVDENFPPAFSMVEKEYEPSERVLVDRRGIVLDELRTNPKVRRLSWTRLRDVSPAFREALLKSEDKRFFEHGGVDWLALGSAVLKLPFADRPRGASTLSMQLSQFLRERRARSRSRTVLEKVDQIRDALKLEAAWTKDEILEAYLNYVSFRGEVQGLRAAAKGFFRKEPSGLNTLESSILAVLVRAPNAPAEKVADRVCWLERKSGDACASLRRDVEALLGRPYVILPSGERLAPVLAARFLPEGTLAKGPTSREVATTLDAGIQRAALVALRQQMTALGPKNVGDGAILVIDNASGEVAAYVANAGFGWSSAPYVDGIRARRQAGSTIKPFLYGLAFERRLLTPASILDDSPSDFEADRSGTYRPRNFDNRFHGHVSARVALGSSLNVPAVRTLLLVREDQALEVLRKAGFGELRDAGYYGPSLGLGTLDASLWELTNAFRVLASGGLHRAARLRPDEPMGRATRVLSREASALVSDILSDREARYLSFGLESPLATRHWTAVKTGTSKDMRDNWCVGYSKRYTIGVWVGNFDGSPMWNVSGVDGAAPIWLDLMRTLEEGTGHSRRPKLPAGVVRASVRYLNSSGSETEVQELFLKGTEPRTLAQEVQEAAPSRARIDYPSDGLLVALDPDIPAKSQRLPFEIRGAAEGQTLTLDGNSLGLVNDEIAHLWLPEKGPHVLELKSAGGQTLDQVRFEVR